MKSLIVLFIISLSAISFSQEDWVLNSISLQTGKTSLTKGMTISASFSKEDYSFIADFNADLGEIIAFHNFSENFSLGLSGGFYKNVLWWGPIMTITLFDEHIKTLHWIGESFGNSEKRVNQLQNEFMFSYQQISFCFLETEVSYAFQNYYQFRPEHIFSLKKTFDLNESTSFFGSGGYMKNEEDFLWSIGVFYKFE